MLKRLFCFVVGHRYRVIALSDRNDRMKDIHPLAGCLARCERCREWWDDLPGSGVRCSK